MTKLDDILETWNADSIDEFLMIVSKIRNICDSELLQKRFIFWQTQLEWFRTNQGEILGQA